MSVVEAPAGTMPHRFSQLVTAAILVEGLVAATVQCVAAQAATASPTTLAGWLRWGVILSDSLVASIPGYVAIEPNTPESCSFTVYLADPESQAPRALEVLAPLVETRCLTDPHIYPVRSNYTRQDLPRLRAELVQMLASAGEPYQDLGFVRGRWRITALNPGHRDRVMALLDRYQGAIRREHVDVRLTGPPYELDRPVDPGPAAYLAIADSLAPETVVDSTGLPSDVVAMLRHRFRLTAGECGTPSLRFDGPRGYTDQRFVVATRAQPAEPRVLLVSEVKHYEVTCRDGACRVTRTYAFGHAVAHCQWSEDDPPSSPASFNNGMDWLPSWSRKTIAVP